MPKRPAKTPAKRVTNEQLAAQIETLSNDVVPRLTRIEALAKKAGLNGFAGDIHDFFEQRAESVAAKQWLTRKLHPLLKFRYLVAVVGFLSTLAWAVLAVKQLIATVPHPPHP